MKITALFLSSVVLFFLDGNARLAGRTFLQPLFGGFSRIAPTAQCDDDDGMEGKKQRRAMHAAVCNIDVKKLVFEVDNKVELVELLLVERSRSVEHNVATAVVFRERDAVAD